MALNTTDSATAIQELTPVEEQTDPNATCEIPADSLICLQINCRILVYTRWQYLRNTSQYSTDEEFLDYLLHLEDERRKIGLQSQEAIINETLSTNIKPDQSIDNPSWHATTTSENLSTITIAPHVPLKIELALDSDSNEAESVAPPVTKHGRPVRALNRSYPEEEKPQHSNQEFTDDDADLLPDDEEYVPKIKKRTGRKAAKKTKGAKKLKTGNVKLEMSSNDDDSDEISGILDESDSSGMKDSLVQDDDSSDTGRNAETDSTGRSKHKQLKKKHGKSGSSNQERKPPPFERYREYLEIVYEDCIEESKPELKCEQETDQPNDIAPELKQFISLSNEMAHYENNTLPVKRQLFRCKKCGKTFTTHKGIYQHIKYHLEKGKFKCSYCDRMFFGPTLRDAHELVHNKQRPLVCEFCGTTFNNKYTLKDHRHMHTGEKPYACSICGASFTHRYKRNCHEKAHTQSFQCDWCGKVFTNLAKLNLHSQKHTGNFKHICSTCGHGFAKIDHLKRHIRIHTGEKPFVCDICTRPFRTPEMLKGHMKTHTKNPPDALGHRNRADPLTHSHIGIVDSSALTQSSHLQSLLNNPNAIHRQMTTLHIPMDHQMERNPETLTIPVHLGTISYLTPPAPPLAVPVPMTLS